MARPSAAAPHVPSLLLGGLLLSVCAIPACNIVGPAMIIIEGPKKYDATYELPKDRPTLVFVDDRSNILPRPRLREMIATRAQEMLLKERVLTKVIDCKGAYAAIAGDREGRVTSTVEIGQAVGAEVVVYVSVDSFAVPNSVNALALECQMRVRVLDVTKDQPRMWPEQREGQEFIAAYRMQPSQQVQSSTDALTLQNTIAEQCGKGIAQLFFKHLASDAARDGK